MEDMTVDKTALIVGGTGLVGGHCLRLLVQQPAYTKVVALLRRPAPIEDARLSQRIVDFDRLEGADFAGVSDVFCALGTTIAKAGSEEAFYEIDYRYPITIARLAEKAGVKQFVLVSSVGADPRSTSFYLRVKGELEQELSAASFAAVHVLRPSLLLGERGEVRKGEAIGVAAAQTLRFTMKGGLRRYRPIDARTVAGAMVAAALGGRNGRHVYHFDDMETLAKGIGVVQA
ncbi:oxidoreductase [Sorangium sp. So ce381]|uniref:oxidoreductase n=1 Tax=Sorangium sp. So ce381 TaxID=3133307 RepID=UPI003F5C40E9